MTNSRGRSGELTGGKVMWDNGYFWTRGTSAANHPTKPSGSWKTAKGFCDPRPPHCKTKTPSDKEACKTLTEDVQGMGFAWRSSGGICEIYYGPTVTSCPNSPGVHWYQNYWLGQDRGEIKGGDGNSLWQCNYNEFFGIIERHRCADLTGDWTYSSADGRDTGSLTMTQNGCTAKQVGDDFVVEVDGPSTMTNSRGVSGELTGGKLMWDNGYF